MSSNSPILIYGPSGTGKTTIGQLIAESLNLPFSDLDIEIETHSGQKIPDIFARDGEAAFREMERTELEQQLKQGGVISLGGGALTHAPTRALAEAQNSHILLLKADPDIMLARLQTDTSNPRPLLQGDPYKKLKAMLERRGAHYAEFPLQLDTSHLTPVEAAWQAQILLGMFCVKGMGKEYDVRVTPGLLDSIGAEMAARGLKGPIALVCDENVGKLYAKRAEEAISTAGYTVKTITVPAGEEHKTLRTVEKMWAGFLAAGIERGSTIVALGGGVLGDLTGFAAAMWLRGAAWVNVPTSLLAMCDSSLGGKTGADLPEGKNLVGAFHPPTLVLADPEVLATLPEEELRNGMAEVLKHGIISDPILLELKGFEDKSGFTEIVRRSMAVKIQVIQEDPYEKGLRQALNLGHTVGHAVELVSGFKLKHGEAVAIGMVAEARLAEKVGLTKSTSSPAMYIKKICQAAGLPTEIPSNLDRRAIRQAMYYDKKRAGGKVKFALPVEIGNVRVGIEIDEQQIATL